MKYLLLLLALHLSTVAISQEPASQYNARNLFPAMPIYPPGTPYRSATGEPGEAYWQNKVDYSINATLDDTQKTISASERITYTNNSPKPLSYIWLQLDQNAFREHSRGLDAHLFLDSNTIKQSSISTYGYQFSAVTLVSTASASVPLSYRIEDTRMQLLLPSPLLPGKSVSILISYRYRIPEYFYNADFNVNRTDILSTKNGEIFSIAQWYPRVCVLDDLEGWNTLPYLGNGEFYLEYGNFQVSITLPAAYIVVASGELLNPAEVLTPLQLKRYEAARQSEQRVFIRKPEEVTDPASRPQKASCTWKFAINHSRDFAWGASKSFIWEGIKINLPNQQKALGLSVYPPESNLAQSWGRSSEYVKFSIEYFSKQWYPYPYPCAVNVASNLDGMEYPGIVFCSAKDTGNNFFKVVKHELGHTWFPMIVGSNERKYAWMDEGFNVFIDYYGDKAFNNGEFNGYTADELPYAQYVGNAFPPILTRPDAMRESTTVFATQYLKTSYALRLLREEVLGPERFDYALRKYLRDWAYKHPGPWDFFRSINNSTGEDLTWFWKSMFLENYALDQAVTDCRYPNNDPSKGAIITLENLQAAAMPVKLEITTRGGGKTLLALPAEIWEPGGIYQLHTTTTLPIEKIELDPRQVLPDINRENNSWMPR